MSNKLVHFINGELDTWANGTIILRGVVDPSDLRYIMVDDYQREPRKYSTLKGMIKTLEKGGSLPDIELGMRGQRFSEKNGIWTLSDPVYVVDGQQRINACLYALDKNPMEIRLGATLHFATTREWEMERFRVLNVYQVKVSPNVLMRNAQETSNGIAMIYKLSSREQSFALKGRIAWSQNMARGDLTTALQVGKTIVRLHSHKVAGVKQAMSVSRIGPALDRTMSLIGAKNMEQNTITFFDTIDECWGLRRIEYRELAPQLKSQFMLILASIFSDYKNFWKNPDEKVLFIDADTRRKLSKFPIRDDGVKQLAGSAGSSGKILYLMLIDHINSGRKKNRLQPRTIEIFEEVEEEETVT